MKTETVGFYKLNNTEFDVIREIVYANTGISLSPTKMELVKRRFTPRLKALGLDSFGDYVDYLKSNFDSEEVHFCNAITTNLTSFFRENHHFELMVERMLPEILKAGGQRVRIWSAGCSTGQEAYCLSIILHKHVPDLQRRNIKILATDLDENCLERARRGSYPVAEFNSVPDKLIKEYFRAEKLHENRQIKDVYTANESIRSLITFNKLNLMHKWPMKGPFDIIFCRNVFIYFDKPTQTEMLKNFAAMQNEGSFLCLGHSEIISNPAALGYNLIGKTAYRKSTGRH